MPRSAVHGFDPSLATAASCAQAQDGWPVTVHGSWSPVAEAGVACAADVAQRTR
ncbi:MAG: hypothetical protein ACK58T_31170 [Phycisphaerae bacterium]